MVTLRPYQQAAVDRLLASELSSILCAPTGAGKTIIASMLIQAFLDRGLGPVIFAAPRRGLVEQTVRSFGGKAKLDVGLFHGSQADETPVICTTPHTLDRRGDKLPAHVASARVILFDECHFAPELQAKVRAIYPAARAIGLSATPWREDGRGLGHFGYEEIIRDIGYQALIDDGFLTDTRVFAGVRAAEIAAMEKARASYDEYTARELQEWEAQFGDLEVDAPKEWRKHAEGKITLAFSSGIAASQRFVDVMNEHGIPAAHIDGKMSKLQRGVLFGALARREILILSCADLLTFGTDLKATTGLDEEVEALMLHRPVGSYQLFLQIIGRAMRPHPGKDRAIILDAVGAHLKHGLAKALDGVEIDLWAEKAPKGEALTKQCPECFAIVAIATAQCPECGYVFPVAEPKPEAQKEQDVLQEIGEDDIAAASGKDDYLDPLRCVHGPELDFALRLVAAARGRLAVADAVDHFYETVGRHPRDLVHEYERTITRFFTPTLGEGRRDVRTFQEQMAKGQRSLFSGVR